MNLGGGNGGGGESALVEFGIAIGRCALENGFVLGRVAERSGRLPLKSKIRIEGGEEARGISILGR